MTPDIRTFVLWQALCWQIDHPGSHLTSPRNMGGTAFAVVKREFGFKGPKEKVLTQLEEYMLKHANGVDAITKRRARKVSA